MSNSPELHRDLCSKKKYTVPLKSKSPVHLVLCTMRIVSHAMRIESTGGLLDLHVIALFTKNENIRIKDTRGQKTKRLTINHLGQGVDLFAARRWH